MRGVLEADEEEQDNHFKHTLTDEEKHQVLDRVLDYHRYNKEAGGRDDSGEDKGDNDASDRKGMGCAGVNIKAALSASIRSRRASDRALGTTTDKEKGEADEDEAEDKEDAKGESSRLCSICLDEYENGEMLAMRPDRCLHVFHRDCLHNWLVARRADCCPICRSSILTEAEWVAAVRNVSQ